MVLLLSVSHLEKVAGKGAGFESLLRKRPRFLPTLSRSRPRPIYFFIDSPTGIVYCILGRISVEHVAGEEDPFLLDARVIHVNPAVVGYDPKRAVALSFSLRRYGYKN